jgi:hypothetical protein
MLGAMIRLEKVRSSLLALHRTLLDAERLEFERVHGRVSAVGFVEALTRDPSFAWLRPLTTLLIEVDELIDATDSPEKQDEQRAVLERLDSMLQPESQSEAKPHTDSDGFARRYAQMLQLSPDAVLSHGAVKQALRWATAET